MDDFDGDVRPHLLVADLRRLTQAAWGRRDEGLTARCLSFFDDALRDGDDDVRNWLQPATPTSARTEIPGGWHWPDG